MSWAEPKLKLHRVPKPLQQINYASTLPGNIYGGIAQDLHVHG